MTIYFVDGNAGNDSTGNGSTGKPWKTLAKATATVQPGDEVRIRTAIYRETLLIPVRNTTWRADTGHKPVLDGRYHDGLFLPNGNLPHPEPDSGYLPSDSEGNMVMMREEGITLDGLTVQNCAGTAIGISRNNSTVRNCRIDFTYGHGLRVNAAGSFVDNVVLENNICTRLVQRLFDPLRVGPGPAAAGSGIVLVRARDGIIRNNLVAYSMGEGIDVGKGSYRLIVESNTVHTCGHIHIYINRAIDSILRNNLIYHLFVEDYLDGEGRPPSGIAIGDEKAQGNPWPHSAGGQIYNNIVVGLRTLFDVRNNSFNYNTQLNRCYVGYNTFIGGDKTDIGIKIAGNMHGRDHTTSLFENNIIFNARDIGHSTGNIGGVAFRNNLWGELPEPAMRGPGDRVGNPNLVKPTAKLGGEFPNPKGNIDPLNYRLTSKSAMAIAKAGDGKKFNGLQPPSVAKDFFGANRDEKPDIGAHEYSGAVTELTANFSIGPGQAVGALPHTVDFTDKTSSTHTVVSRRWNFGDGESSIEINPSHTYSEPGRFDVSLTVTDDRGNTDTLTLEGFISISSAPNPVIPNAFRRFILTRIADRQVLAFGTQYPDMRCILIWKDEPFHLLNFADIEDIDLAFVQADAATLLWIDPGDRDEESAPLPIR